MVQTHVILTLKNKGILMTKAEVLERAEARKVQIQVYKSEIVVSIRVAQPSSFRPSPVLERKASMAASKVLTKVQME